MSISIKMVLHKNRILMGEDSLKSQDHLVKGRLKATFPSIEIRNERNQKWLKLENAKNQNSHKINVLPKCGSVRTSNSKMPLLRILGSCSAVTMGSKKFCPGSETTWVMQKGTLQGKKPHMTGRQGLWYYRAVENMNYLPTRDLPSERLTVGKNAIKLKGWSLQRKMGSTRNRKRAHLVSLYQ